MLRKQRCSDVLKSFRKRPVARYGLNNETLFLEESAKCQMNSQSSHRRCSLKEDVLENFSKFTGKRLCLTLFFIKVAGLRSAT